MGSGAILLGTVPDRHSSINPDVAGCLMTSNDERRVHLDLRLVPVADPNAPSVLMIVAQQRVCHVGIGYESFIGALHPPPLLAGAPSDRNTFHFLNLRLQALSLVGVPRHLLKVGYLSRDLSHHFSTDFVSYLGKSL